MYWSESSLALSTTIIITSTTWRRGRKRRQDQEENTREHLPPCTSQCPHVPRNIQRWWGDPLEIQGGSSRDPEGFPRVLPQARAAPELPILPWPAQSRADKGSFLVHFWFIFGSFSGSQSRVPPHGWELPFTPWKRRQFFHNKNWISMYQEEVPPAVTLKSGYSIGWARW